MSLLLLILLYFSGSKVQIAGYAATTMGPNNERSENNFDFMTTVAAFFIYMVQYGLDQLLN